MCAWTSQKAKLLLSSLHARIAECCEFTVWQIVGGAAEEWRELAFLLSQSVASSYDEEILLRMSVKYELLPGNVPRRGNLSLCISRRRLSTAILGVICLISLLAWIRPERPIIAIHPAEEPVQALNSSSSQADLVPSSSPSTAAVESTPVPDSPRPLLHFNDPKPCNRLSTTRVNGTVWMSPSPALPTYATLNDRLTAWLQSPLSSHANWTAFNNQTCGSSHVARAANQLHDRQNQATWQAMDAVEVAKLRYELVGMLRNASVDGKIPKRPTADPSERSSQGIVFTAGNAVSPRVGYGPIGAELTERYCFRTRCPGL